jgi:paraquat-inducible protein A
MLSMAAERGLATCGGCGLLSRAEEGDGAAASCPRCGTRLHLRRVDSVQRTGALLLAAAICYVPANVLPVLVTTALGGTGGDTIVSGVARLYDSGSWFLAAIVAIASVMIPPGKIAVLACLLFVVKRRHAAHSLDCTRLHRLVRFIGRWSMLDVFAAAFVVSVVQWGAFMSETPGPGLAFFAATAVFTMLAAMAFDPRLIWDVDAGRQADARSR